MSRLVYLDSSVIIEAARGRSALIRPLLEDPEVRLASSVFVQLETLPKCVYTNRRQEVEACATIFSAVEEWSANLGAVTKAALSQAQHSGLSGMDALHVAAAFDVGADELLTIEGTEKALYRNTLIKVRQLI